MIASSSNTAWSPVAVGNILLVEDTAAHVELIRRALAGTVDRLTVVDSVAGARAVLDSHDPVDLLIVDLVLPDGRGTDLLAEESVADVMPVIVLTAQGDEHSAVDALKRGALDYIPKSAESMANMATIVQRVLREWEHILARREAESALRLLNANLEERVRQRSAELAEACERLQELDRMKSKFIDDISHQLRTPITGFSLYLDLLERCEPEHRDKYEAGLRKQSDRLISLLDSILDFSKQHKSLKQANLVSIDLNKLVSKVVAAFEQRAQDRGLLLSFTASAEVLQVWGDAEQLEQVVSNLLNNATSYTLCGHVCLSTQRTSNGDQVRLTVEDTGIGLDEEALAHCFERFYRGKRVGQYNIVPGAGLGLTTVKEIVEFHGGRVQVESEIDSGSTFSVYLPAYKGGDQ